MGRGRPVLALMHCLGRCVYPQLVIGSFPSALSTSLLTQSSYHKCSLPTQSSRSGHSISFYPSSLILKCSGPRSPRKLAASFGAALSAPPSQDHTCLPVFYTLSAISPSHVLILFCPSIFEEILLMKCRDTIDFQKLGITTFRKRNVRLRQNSWRF